MKETSIEKLKEMFPVQNVAPYGDCVVVPGSNFDPDWEVSMVDQGYECFHIDLDKKPVTLVQLITKVTKLQSDNVTKSAREEAGLQRVLKGKDSPLGPRWTEDDYKILIKLWNEGKKVRVIASNFQDRSGHAVAAALARLKNSGVIKPRWTQKKNRFSKEAEPPTPSSEKTTLKGSLMHAPVINTSLTIQLNVNCNDAKAVANFLKVIEKLGETLK